MPLLIDHLSDPLPTGIESDLTERVRFRSPFTDYEGRDDVAHLVGLIRGVLQEVRSLDQLDDASRTFSMFEARVAGEEVQGTLFERRDEAGRLVDAMLTVRPYAGLRAAMKAMQVKMEEAPLPGAGR